MASSASLSPISLLLSITPTLHTPALRPSAMSTGVSPTFTTAAGGYTPTASIARKIIHGAGRPAGTSSAQMAKSGTYPCSRAAAYTTSAASRK